MGFGTAVTSLFWQRDSPYLAGGPKEGWLQKRGVGARAGSALMVLVALSMSQSAVFVAAVFAMAGLIALLSFLRFWQAAMTAAVPALLFGLPTVGAGLLAQNGVSGNFFLIPFRIQVAVTVGLLASQSIGLIRLSHLFGPGTLGVTWLTAVQQTGVMAEHVQEMKFAQRSRTVVPQTAMVRRRQIGAQAGAFLSKCMTSAEVRSMGLQSRGAYESRGFGRHLSSPLPHCDIGLITGGVAVLVAGYLW